MLVLVPVLCSCGVWADAEKSEIDLASVGYVQVQSPVDGARVYFDRVFMGFIQNGILTIPVDVIARPQYSDLIIEYTGYPTYIGPLPNPIPGKTVGVRAELNTSGYERQGIISLESGVPGAELLLNGVSKGVTPDSGVLLIETVPSGLYEFTVKRPGNLSITKQQYVSSNAVTFYRVELQPAHSGEVRINSTPEGAGIYLNNRYLGVSPLNIPDVPVGNQSIRITYDGYQDWTGQVIVVGAGSDNVDAVLVSLPPSPTPACPEPTPISSPVSPLENGVPLYAGVMVFICIIGCIILVVWIIEKQKK